MTAFTGTPTSSTQYNKQTAGSGTAKVDAATVDAGLRFGRFSYTHSAGNGTGEVNLIALPPGHFWVLSDLSRLVSSQFEANADLHLGFRAYREPDGDAVNEDDNAFSDNENAGGGALDQAWALPAAGLTEFNVDRSTAAAYDDLGFVIYAMVDTANIEDTDTLDGWVVWAGQGHS